MSCTVGSEGRSWYALKVRTRSEALAASALRNRGFEPFAPICYTRHKFSDGFRDVQTAAFPGYIFCSFDRQQRTAILSAPAVDYVVTFSGVPVTLTDGELDAIRRVVEAGAKPESYMCVGERVRIEYGPLAGVEGILTRRDGASRLVVSVDVLQRSVSVRIDADQLSKVQRLNGWAYGGSDTQVTV